jgi:hypothetical protein
MRFFWVSWIPFGRKTMQLSRTSIAIWSRRECHRHPNVGRLYGEGIAMPVLDIIDRDNAMRWDAPGRLGAALYFPREPKLRLEYEACWRAENKHLLPLDKRLTRATAHSPARGFGRRKIDFLKRWLRVERIGTALWIQAILSMTDPSSATESKVAYTLGELKQRDIKTSRSTLKRDWTTHRGVVQWCAAIAYQRKVFGKELPMIGPPDYSIYAALWDFLRLGNQFFAFARDSGCFATTPNFRPERDLWTLPSGIWAVAPKRDPAWPDCDSIRADILPDPDVLAPLQDYSATLYRG